MDHFEIYPYRKTTVPPKSCSGRVDHWQSLKTKFGESLAVLRKLRPAILYRWLSVPVLLTGLLGFLAGRGVLLQDLRPFAPAVVAAVYMVYPGYAPVALLAGAVGVLSYGIGPVAWAGVANLLFVWLVLRLVGLESKKADFSLGILVFAATVIIKTIAISLTAPVLYDYGVALIEAIIAAIMTIALQRALQSVSEKGPLDKMALDQRISLGVLLLTCLSGLRGLELQGVSLLGVFSRVVILLAVSSGGMGVGAVSGILVGLVPGLAGGANFPISVGVFSFGGLMAGIFSGFGRFGAPIGLLFSNIFWSVYLSSPESLLIMVLETLFAIALYWIMPVLTIISPGEKANADEDAVPTDKNNPGATRKLNRFAKVFDELAETFDQLSSEGRVAQWREENLVTKIGEQACQNCSKARICWEKSGGQTRKALWNLVSLVEIDGNLVDVPPSLENGQCIHPRELLMAVRCMVSNKYHNQYWQQRFKETQEMVSGQLRGISSIMESLAQDSEYPCEITTEPEELCQPLSVEVGIAKVAKDGSLISGDSHLEFFLKKGCFVVALSDGMGTGPEAAEESRATVNLLARLMEAGFPEELAVKTVNSALGLRAQEDSFATLDLMILDLSFGLTRFVKIGAAASFIKRGDNIGLIKSTSLPIGILQQVEADIVRQEVEPGDIVILMSDGLLESATDIIDKEQWVIDVLVGCRTADPQNLADYLLNKGRQNAGNRVPDDMTVLVIKVVENQQAEVN